MSNGKGDSPRNCFSKRFKDNYDSINWGHAKTIDDRCGSPKGTFKKFTEEQEEELRYKVSVTEPVKSYEDLQREAWESEYKDYSFIKGWEDFRDHYSLCCRCNSYQKGSCICYSR
jgi:hypothetical protein